MTEHDKQFLLSTIKTIPDHPKPGIMFRDVTSLMQHGEAFSLAIDLLAKAFESLPFDKVIGTEARGFIFGAPIAKALGVGFVPVRKAGKLPREVVSESYELEYGQDTLQIHTDAISKGDKVLLIDDLIATGGTAQASISLVEQLGGTVTHAGFVINLVDLPGIKQLEDRGVSTVSLCEFEGE